MNYLAHALLAGPDPHMMLGGLMGDFVKGRLDERWDEPLRSGLRLHRRIDVFTDQHPVVAASRARIAPPRRRFAGIIIDVCYDHFLARDFERWSGGRPLAEFTCKVYDLLLRHHARLPERLQHIAPLMTEQDWLASYAQLAAVGVALDGISRRRPRIAPLAGALADVRPVYDELAADFEDFFPALLVFADHERDSAAGSDR